MGSHKTDNKREKKIKERERVGRRESREKEKKILANKYSHSGRPYTFTNSLKKSSIF